MLVIIYKSSLCLSSAWPHCQKPLSCFVQLHLARTGKVNNEDHDDAFTADDVCDDNVDCDDLDVYKTPKVNSANYDDNAERGL